MVDKDNLKGVDLEWNTDRWENIYFYKKPKIVEKREGLEPKKNHVKKGREEKSPKKELEKRKKNANPKPVELIIAVCQRSFWG